MKKFLLMMLGTVMTLPAFALEFTYEYNGQTLTYIVLDENAKTVETKTGNKVSGELIIPAEVTYGEDIFKVTSIGKEAFVFCSGLTSVSIPATVTSISERAFMGCSGLTSILIPEGVTSISDGAFANCSSLTSVSIPATVTSISERAFMSCSSLTSVSIPKGVTEISAYTFSYCSSLTSISIPNRVTLIDESAFMSCYSLTSVSIPDGVTEIGNNAFFECTGLEKVEFASIESLCKISFKNCSANPLCYAPHLYINGEKVIDVVIPNGVSEIRNNTFYNCVSLRSVSIPESVTSIGDFSFYNCSDLTSVSIPESVTSIGKGAFSQWYRLTSVSIPENVTYIGENAFYNCISLTSVYYPADKPIEGSANIFSNETYEKAMLYMSKEGVIQSSDIEPWKYFKNINEFDPAGIDEISADFDKDAPCEIYNLSGVKVGDTLDRLTPGLYIIRQGRDVKKITVK